MLSREERAKQFLAFDALSGFYKELQKKEKQIETEYMEEMKPKEEQREEET